MTFACTNVYIVDNDITETEENSPPSSTHPATEEDKNICASPHTWIAVSGIFIAFTVISTTASIILSSVLFRNSKLLKADKIKLYTAQGTVCTCMYM